MTNEDEQRHSDAAAPTVSLSMVIACMYVSLVIVNGNSLTVESTVESDSRYTVLATWSTADPQKKETWRFQVMQLCTNIGQSPHFGITVQ